jgi:hypothetical protein
MDCYDYLFKIRNQFYLGHHQEVFSMWKSLERDLDKSSSDFVSQKKHYIEVLVFAHRSMSHFLRSDESTVQENQSMLEKFNNSLAMYLDFQGKTHSELAEGKLQQELTRLSEWPNKTEEGDCLSEFLELSKRVLHNYLCFKVRKFDLFIGVDKKYAETYMDSLMMRFQAFCMNNQHKEAERCLENMKAENDEHILANFAEFEVENRIRRNHQEALSVLLEMKQKFGESPKLINLNIASLILKREFFKVDWLIP